MLQGAIIGMVAALVMVVITAVRNNKGGKKIMAALDADDAAGARAALDAYAKPPGVKVRAGQMPLMIERFAWLGIIGDLETLENEYRSLNVSNKGVSYQLRTQAITSLLAHRTDPADLEELQALYEDIQANGGAMLGLIKKLVAAHLAVARGLQGVAIDPAHLTALNKRSQALGPGTTIMLQRFIARSVQAVGMDPSQHHTVIASVFSRLRK